MTIDKNTALETKDSKTLYNVYITDVDGDTITEKLGTGLDYVLAWLVGGWNLDGKLITIESYQED